MPPSTYYAVLLALVLGVGCGGNQTAKETPKETPPKTKVTEDNNTKPIKADDDNATKPVKELTLEEKVVGEYEYKHINGNTLKQVLLDNGVWGYYSNGKKLLEFKWSIVNGEIHVKDDSVFIDVYRINKDKSITEIGEITDGKRKDIPKEHQWTFKKIKYPPPLNFNETKKTNK